MDSLRTEKLDILKMGEQLQAEEVPSRNVIRSVGTVGHPASGRRVAVRGAFEAITSLHISNVSMSSRF
jgi:hypothetical protein